MIGNRYLQALFAYSDEDTSLNQLLEFLKYKDLNFINSLSKEALDIDACNNEEIEYLTKASALIDYYLQIHGIEVPVWLRNEKLVFENPYYHSKRIKDFDKVKLQYTNPSPFRTRNVYFDLQGINRV
jgi:hypothetical protein